MGPGAPAVPHCAIKTRAPVSLRGFWEKKEKRRRRRIWRQGAEITRPGIARGGDAGESKSGSERHISEAACV